MGGGDDGMKGTTSSVHSSVSASPGGQGIRFSRLFLGGRRKNIGAAGTTTTTTTTATTVRVSFSMKVSGFSWQETQYAMTPHFGSTVANSKITNNQPALC